MGFQSLKSAVDAGKRRRASSYSSFNFRPLAQLESEIIYTESRPSWWNRVVHHHETQVTLTQQFPLSPVSLVKAKFSGTREEAYEQAYRLVANDALNLAPR